MNRHRCKPFVSAAMALMFAGCTGPAGAPATRPATAVDPKQATSQYWFNLPAIEHVEGGNYDALWTACERTAIQSSFVIDRADYRDGYMTTKPLVSKQFFEFWKNDVVDFHSQQQSDLATRRRIVHFQISRRGDRFVCEPKAVVEHYSMTERRITEVYQYREAFSVRRQLQEEQTDEGAPVRVEYWYAERRDSALEHALAERLRANLQALASAR